LLWLLLGKRTLPSSTIEHKYLAGGREVSAKIS
jgi:hypothetical protein